MWRWDFTNFYLPTSFICLLVRAVVRGLQAHVTSADNHVVNQATLVNVGSSTTDTDILFQFLACYSLNDCTVVIFIYVFTVVLPVAKDFSTVNAHSLSTFS